MEEDATSAGRITSGISPGTLAQRTIDFVYSQLPLWRDDPDRPSAESEEVLNAQLCSFLNAAAGEAFPMVMFHHEERQTGRRRVDLSAKPRQAMWVGPRRHTIYQPFLVFEGKRLPAPSRDREHEYVDGGERRSGGIQRFKLGLHGTDLEVAAIIGYIQSDTVEHWFSTINGWILALATAACGSAWEPGDSLHDFTPDKGKRSAACQSEHSRSCGKTGASLRLHHLWVVMEGQDRTCAGAPRPATRDPE